MSYTLQSRQKRLYRDVVDIYRKVPGAPVNGHLGEPSCSVVGRSVPCYIQSGESVKAPVQFLVDEQDNMFTYDIVHFPDGVNVDAGDVLRVRAGGYAGSLYTVRGDPKIRNLRANALTIRANRTPLREAWVPEE